MLGWNYLKSHPSNSDTPLPDVIDIAKEEWHRLKTTCHLNDVYLSVKYDYIFFANKPGVLAVASRTMFLIDNEWQSGAINRYNAKGVIDIKINPFVPNGWYDDSDGRCRTGYRYDLRTVVRHELVHGAGISSSVRGDSAGYVYGEKCYATAFDHKIVNDEGEAVVHGCAVSETRSDMYVSNVKLYNPPQFRNGSSFSHAEGHGLMHFSIAPMTCIDYDTDSFRMLNGVGASCDGANFINAYTNGTENRYSNFYVYILLLVTIKCLMCRSNR